MWPNIGHILAFTKYPICYDYCLPHFGLCWKGYIWYLPDVTRHNHTTGKRQYMPIVSYWNMECEKSSKIFDEHFNFWARIVLSFFCFKNLIRIFSALLVSVSEQTVLAKHCEISNLFNQLNASCQIHTKIDKLPCNTFSGVLFLFQYEHVMVEKLLKLFVSKVNAKLFKSVILKK